MPMPFAVPTPATQVDRCSQVLHAATTRQVGLQQMGNGTGAAMKLIKCMYAAESVYLECKHTIVLYSPRNRVPGEAPAVLPYVHCPWLDTDAPPPAPA